MNFSWGRTAASWTLLTAVAAVASGQVTTGRLVGTTRDATGAGVPGVTVTISSPSLLGGDRVATSDSDGRFQFIRLDPGTYVVQTDRAGFVGQAIRQVKVTLGGTAWLAISMPRARFEDEIEVSDETPVIDPSQVNTEQIFDGRYLANATVGSRGRSYQAVLRHAAGVTGGNNPNVFGSTLSENAYFIDGQDTTDPLTSTWGSEFSFDSIAEVELQTSGFEAEYGRATGGVVNVVTKSGGNDLSGTFDVRFSGTKFQESGRYFDADDLPTSLWDVAGTLGGPVLRDRLWFFVAAQRRSEQETPVGSPTTRTRTGNNGNVKLSWQAGESWRLVGRAATSPADISNGNASRFTASEAASFQSQRTDLLSLDVSGIMGANLVWTGVLGAYRASLDLYPASGDLRTPAHLDYSSGMLTGNFTTQQYSDRSRNDLASDLTWFADAGGSHEIKGGLEVAGTRFDAASCTTGTEGGACEPASTGVVYQDLGPGVPYFLIESQTAGMQSYIGRLETVYLQDSWRPVALLTVKVGVRYDTVSYDNNRGAQVADMARLQPRLGIAWDVRGDATNVLRASWGRFMDPSSLTLASVLRVQNEPTSRWSACSTIGSWAFGVTSREQCAELAASLGWSFRADDPDGLEPWGWFRPPWEVSGLTGTTVEGNLEAPYADTLSLSYERELWRRSSFEVAFVDKKTRSLFEDTCEGNIPLPTEGASCDGFVLANLAELARDYRAVSIRLESRTFDWLTLLGSYTYSSSKGNLGYSQGENYDFDVYPYHWVNRYGLLSDHRRHRVKVNGWVRLGADWTVAFDGFWSSASAWQPQADPGDDPRIPGGLMFLEPRGSRDGFSASRLDVQLSKGFAVAGGRLVILGSVFNLLDREYPTVVCSDVGGCGEFATGKAIDWAPPRSYELGLRFEF